MAQCYVYMLADDRLNLRYIGSTNDLRKRLVFHRRRLTLGFTRK